VVANEWWRATDDEGGRLWLARDAWGDAEITFRNDRARRRAGLALIVDRLEARPRSAD
jgi:hypothetical protein